MTYQNSTHTATSTSTLNVWIVTRKSDGATMQRVAKDGKTAIERAVNTRTGFWMKAAY